MGCCMSKIQKHNNTFVQAYFTSFKKWCKIDLHNLTQEEKTVNVFGLIKFGERFALERQSQCKCNDPNAKSLYPLAYKCETDLLETHSHCDNIKTVPVMIFIWL